MKKNYLLKSVAIFTVLSAASGSNLSFVKAESNLPNIAQTNSVQENQAIRFKDPAIEQGAMLALLPILGRPATPDDLTQENLNKIKMLATFGKAKLSTLEDLPKMPNLETVGLQSTNASTIIDSTPLKELKHLKSFNFWQLESQLTSLTPLADKPLEELIVHSLPVLDDSERDLNKMSDLKSINIFYMSNNKKVHVENLDNLSNLKEITLNQMNLSEAPTLLNSKQLEYVDFSDNDLTLVPVLPHSENLWHVGMDRNKVDNYDNVEELLQLPEHPSVSLQSNFLTYLPSFETPSSKSLDLDGNFIINEGLNFQHAIKNIPTQSMTVGQQKDIPITFEDEGGHPIFIDLTNHQKEFLSLSNMCIETDNGNVTIVKNPNSLTINSKQKGNTKIMLSYKGNLNTQFEVNIE